MALENLDLRSNGPKLIAVVSYMAAIHGDSEK